MTQTPSIAATRLAALRTVLADDGLDGFILPRGDEHLGEYVAPYAERLAWLTGFTGSAGVVVVLADEAAVFVPVMMAAQKPVATTPSITIETAGIVVRAECGVDVGWLAAVLRVVKGLS